MTAGRYLVIQCDARADGEECDRERGWPVAVDTVAELRRLLRTVGWHHTRGRRDICPGCWEAARRMTADTAQTGTNPTTRQKATP